MFGSDFSISNIVIFDASTTSLLANDIFSVNIFENKLSEWSRGVLNNGVDNLVFFEVQLSIPQTFSQPWQTFLGIAKSSTLLCIAASVLHFYFIYINLANLNKLVWIQKCPINKPKSSFKPFWIECLIEYSQKMKESSSK